MTRSKASSDVSIAIELEEKYPLVEGENSTFPSKACCATCGKSPVFEPNEFVVLSAGAMLMDRKEGFGEPSESMDGFLDLTWHEAHGETEPGRGFSIPLGKSVRGGQLGIFCCSIACLRMLLNECLDDMEAAIREIQTDPT